MTSKSRLTLAMLSWAIILGIPLSEQAIGAETSIEFSFLEHSRRLRESPQGPNAQKDAYALGEYYFRHRNYIMAADCFRRADSKDLHSAEGVIAAAHLALCGSDRSWKERLEEAVSDEPLFMMSDAAPSRPWRSPLGYRYEFKSGADRIEILQNGRTFYVIELA